MSVLSPSPPLRDAAAAVRFTADGAVAGARAVLPILPGAVAFAMVYGFIAGEKGLSVLEVALSSLLIFAGAAQLLALELWSDPLPLAALIAGALIINLRHLMMGPALLPWLAPLPAGRAYGSPFLMTDETWAVSVAELRRGGRDAAFLPGAGLCLWLVFVAASVAGRLAGDVSALLDGWGLRYLTTAFFVALLGGFWRGRGDLLPWLLAGGLAVAAQAALPGSWHVLLGALAGSLAGAVIQRDGRR